MGEGIATSEGRHSDSGAGISRTSSRELELLAPAKLFISTHVVVGETRLEASQLGLVQ